MADSNAHRMRKTMKGLLVLAVLLAVLPAVLSCTAIPVPPAAGAGASPLATPVAGGCRYDEIKGAVSCEQTWWGEDCPSELPAPGTLAFVAEAWVDANENGKWDEGEAPLPGARLRLSVWEFNPCTSNYFSVGSCSPEGVEIQRGLGDSDLLLLMGRRCRWQDGLAAATDSQGRIDHRHRHGCST